jgi:hypothetical protein
MRCQPLRSEDLGSVFPAEDDSRARRSFIERKLHLDVYGHTLDWRANEEAAQKLGDELGKAVAEKNSGNSYCLTACKTKKLPFSQNGSLLDS